MCIIDLFRIFPVIDDVKSHILTYSHTLILTSVFGNGTSFLRDSFVTDRQKDRQRVNYRTLPPFGGSKIDSGSFCIYNRNDHLSQRSGGVINIMKPMCDAK